jgi:Tfp pilus assembly protein PilF
MAREQWDLAIADLSKVAARASIAWPEPGQELAKAYYQRGVDYMEKGEREKAITDLQKAIELAQDAYNAELKTKAKQKLEELGVKER